MLLDQVSQELLQRRLPIDPFIGCYEPRISKFDLSFHHIFDHRVHRRLRYFIALLAAAALWAVHFPWLFPFTRSLCLRIALQARIKYNQRTLITQKRRHITRCLTALKLHLLGWFLIFFSSFGWQSIYFLRRSLVTLIADSFCVQHEVAIHRIILILPSEIWFQTICVWWDLRIDGFWALRRIQVSDAGGVVIVIVGLFCVRFLIILLRLLVADKRCPWI